MCYVDIRQVEKADQSEITVVLMSEHDYVNIWLATLIYQLMLGILQLGCHDEQQCEVHWSVEVNQSEQISKVQ